MMDQRRLWELAAKKMAGEATPQELQELDKLLQEHPEMRSTLGIITRYWALPCDQTGKENDLDLALQHHRQRFENRFHDIPGENRPGSFRYRIPVKRWMAGSLAALVLSLLGVAAYRTWKPAAQQVASPSPMSEVVTKNGSRTHLFLPDSTEVWLNAGSRLTYPTDFLREPERVVYLSGEAFFEVKHDELHPFVIHTRHINIRDIGTAFNVRDYPQDKVTEATLVRGAIEVVMKDNPSSRIILKPNEKITFYEEREVLVKAVAGRKAAADRQPEASIHFKVSSVAPRPADSLLAETAWLEDKLIFKSESFEDLAERLERWYDVKIAFRDEKVRQYSFTGVFADETVEQALKELQMIRPFHFAEKNRQIIISE